MAIQEIRTFRQIVDAIIQRAKLADTTSIRNELQELVNTHYQKLGAMEDYRWSGDTRSLFLKKKYTTGTVTVTEGSDEITGSGTSWVEVTHLYNRIKIGTASYPFQIIRVDDSSQTIVLSAPYTKSSASGVTYEIFRDERGLWPDTESVRKIIVPGSLNRVLPIPPDEMQENRLRAPFATGAPQRYTVDGLGHYHEKTWSTFNLGTDFWEPDTETETEKQKKIILWPAILTVDTPLEVRMGRLMPAMLSDADEPLIPFGFRPILVYAALKERFLKDKDPLTQNEWMKAYKDYETKLAADIESSDDELLLQVNRMETRRSPTQLLTEEEILQP